MRAPVTSLRVLLSDVIIFAARVDRRRARKRSDVATCRNDGAYGAPVFAAILFRVTSEQ